MAQVLREALALRDEQPTLDRPTLHGARTHAVLASVLQTLKQQGREALGYMASVLKASSEPPKILSPP